MYKKSNPDSLKQLTLSYIASESEQQYSDKYMYYD